MYVMQDSQSHNAGKEKDQGEAVELGINDTYFLLISIVDDDTAPSSRKEIMFGHLIQDVLEDAQSRLVFRAQTYIHNDIQRHQLKPDDLHMGHGSHGNFPQK
jgi:hypothetical protein